MASKNRLTLLQEKAQESGGHVICQRCRHFMMDEHGRPMGTCSVSLPRAQFRYGLCDLFEGRAA